MTNAMKSAARRDAAGLWAITCYFNPVGYRRRLANYRVFRQQLSVPLVAVELAYGPNFELNESDAEILLQLRGGDVMWQKERLLNVALNALPNDCRKVAWLDCDIVFEADDWPERVSNLLDRFMVVQTFSHVYHLPHDWKLGDLRTAAAKSSAPSSMFAMTSGLPIREFLCPPVIGRMRKGLSWAARRELLDQHGFYDARIIGGGDTLMACAFFGYFEAVFRRKHMNDRQQEHFLAWAEPVARVVRGAAGVMEGNIFHLWHGDLNARQLRTRDQDLSGFDFDPFEDIALNASGCWRWNTNKPAMHDFMRKYFVSRREDG
jgi:hypothetical protein